MTIGSDHKTETAYIKEKQEGYNANEPGKGNKWKYLWLSVRAQKYEPAFRSSFARFSKLIVTDDAAYTLIVATTRTEPGWNVGIPHAPAEIDTDIIIVEAADRKNVIAEIKLLGVPGNVSLGNNIENDTRLRIENAYSNAGKEIGKLIANSKGK